jgi:hypothetical protein
MARLTTDSADLVVALSWLEKLAAFRGDARIPLADVREVAVEPNGWGALRGIRSPGTGPPGVIAYGTRRYAGGRDFAAVLGKRPAVRIDFADRAPFRRVVATVADPAAAAARVQTAAGVAPTRPAGA